MAKILTGSTISYGAVLPSGPTVVDGALFFLTTQYLDQKVVPNVLRNPGLYLFSFKADISTTAGNQVGSGWTETSTASGIGYVQKAGDTMSGLLAITVPGSSPAMRINSDAPGIRFTEADQGVNLKEWLVVADGATFQIQTRDDAFVTANTVFSLNRSGGLLVGGQTVWTAGNDGAGSLLDADLLDGFQGLDYMRTDRSNWVGSLGVSQGGTGTTTSPSLGGVIYGASGTQYASTPSGTAGQLLQSNAFGAPVWVNQSTIAAGSASSAPNYVLKTGDTMSGSLSTTALGVNASVGAAGTITAGSNITALGFISASGNVVSNGGNIIVGTGGTGTFIGGNASFGGSQASPMFAFSPWSGTGGASNGFYMQGANEVRMAVAGLVAVIYSPGDSLFTGNLRATADVVSYASDGRLKKNITIIPNALQKVKSLGGYEYDWDMEKVRRLGFKPNNEHEHGLIAQEVQKVLPDAVVPAPFNSDYLTVKYDRLVALLVAAMNEQQEQIAELTEEVGRLTSMVRSM